MNYKNKFINNCGSYGSNNHIFIIIYLKQVKMSLLKVDTDEDFQRFGNNKPTTSKKLKAIGALSVMAACALVGFNSIESLHET